MGRSLKRRPRKTLGWFWPRSSGGGAALLCSELWPPGPICAAVVGAFVVVSLMVSVALVPGYVGYTTFLIGSRGVDQSLESERAGFTS